VQKTKSFKLYFNRVTNLNKDSKNWDDLLTLAKGGDKESLNILAKRLEPGLITITKTSLFFLPVNNQQTIVEQTLSELKEKIQSIRKSTQGFARALLHNRIMNSLLTLAKNGEKNAINELFRLLHVRLRDDPQFSSQGWGMEIDDDLLQDSSIVFLNKMDTEVKDNPYQYFKQIVKFKIHDKINAKKRTRERIDDSVHTRHSSNGTEEVIDVAFDIPYDDSFDQRVEDQDELNHILYALDDLSDFCRDFFKTLFRNQNEKLWRITAKMEYNMSETALNTRIHRCRHSLKNILQNRGVV